MLFRVLLSVLPPLLALIVVAPATGNDRHAGYYYPPIASDEVYRARSRVMDDADRAMRIGFIVAQTEAQKKRIYPPRYAIFTKGQEAEKLIIVGLDGHSFSTQYGARGVLAQLTASSRASALFRNLAVDDLFTFFDLVRMLGFKKITVSEGKTYSYRIHIK